MNRFLRKLIIFSSVIFAFVPIQLTESILDGHDNKENLYSKRSDRTIPWDWDISALKCSLQILSNQVTRYHNNRMLCCGLWKVKWFIKKSALEMCENANESLTVFDQIISEELIYSSFAKSMLGNEALNCADYKENSVACTQLFSISLVILTLAVLTVIGFIVTFFFLLHGYFYWRHRYRLELKHIHNKF